MPSNANLLRSGDERCLTISTSPPPAPCGSATPRAKLWPGKLHPSKRSCVSQVCVDPHHYFCSAMRIFAPLYCNCFHCWFILPPWAKQQHPTNIQLDKS